MEDEVSKKADAYIAMLQQSADMCEEGGVMLCSNSSSSSIFDQELHVSWVSSFKLIVTLRYKFCLKVANTNLTDKTQ